MTSNLPNQTNDLKVFPNEYIDSVTLNRPFTRLLVNDKYLEEILATAAVFTDVPSGITAPGVDGQIAVDDTYLYIYSPKGTDNWPRIELDYTTYTN